MICKHIILYPKNVIHERHWIQFNKCNRYNLLRKKCQMENMNSEKKQERKVRGLFYHYDISAEYSTSSLWEALKSRITINFFWTQNSIQNSHKIFLLAQRKHYLPYCNTLHFFILMWPLSGFEFENPALLAIHINF